MSLARSSGQGGGRITAILAFVFPAMIAAALALAYFGYLGAQNVVAIARGQWERNAARDATELGQKVDGQLNVTVNAFMTAVQAAINDPLTLGAERCNVDVPTPGFIEGYVIFFDKPGQRTPIDNVDCSGPQRLSPKLRQGDLEPSIRTNRDLFEWKTIARSLKYVHVNDNLFAVTRFKSAAQENKPEQSYFLVAKLDLHQIRRQVLSGLLMKLCDQYRVALINRADSRTLRDSVLCGSEPVEGEGFYYEGSFEPNLYAWNLRLAASEEEKVNAETTIEWQKVINPLFVLVSTVIIAVGMGIVLLSVVAERRASRLKSDFIANVSHELKTPLSLIRMFGEMVATGRHKGEETAREYGSIITRESERLSHLIDNVLDFARLERGKASYDFVEGDLAIVLERALDVCRYRLDKETPQAAHPGRPGPAPGAHGRERDHPGDPQPGGQRHQIRGRGRGGGGDAGPRARRGGAVGARLRGPGIPARGADAASSTASTGPRARGTATCAAAASACRWSGTSPRRTAARYRWRARFRRPPVPRVVLYSACFCRRPWSNGILTRVRTAAVSWSPSSVGRPAAPRPPSHDQQPQLIQQPCRPPAAASASSSSRTSRTSPAVCATPWTSRASTWPTVGTGARGHHHGPFDARPTWSSST